MAIVISKRYETFIEFYPIYLSEHANRICRELHFAGSTLALLCVTMLFLTGDFWWLLAAFASNYGFAWIGHYYFEKSQPASFRQPFYSFIGDWVMYWQMLTGQASF